MKAHPTLAAGELWMGYKGRESKPGFDKSRLGRTLMANPYRICVSSPLDKASLRN
jgi:hypothetical protein